MRCSRSSCLALVAALALSGCSYGDSVLDWATGTTAATNTGTPNTPSPTTSAASREPAVTATALSPGTSPSTTLVGQKIQSLQTEATQFQGNVARRQADFTATQQSLVSNASSYSTITAAVDTRLQAGTTAGNPDLVAQWGQAQSLLDQMSSSVTHLIGISNDAANDSSFGNYLVGEIHAVDALRGGTDSDRDTLRQLAAQTTSSLAQSDQLHGTVGDEVTRRNTYIAGERAKLASLALAIQNGRSSEPRLAGRQVTPAAAVAAAPRGAAPERNSAAPAAPSASDRPLVVIRFDEPNVDYEQPLYTAVSRALERKPSATFTIQAVAPNAGSASEVAASTKASRENAEKVLRSLTAMGLPADRISLSASMTPDIQNDEVRLFVR